MKRGINEPKVEENLCPGVKLGRKVNEGNEVNQEGQLIAGHTRSITALSTRLPIKNSKSALSPLISSLLSIPRLINSNSDTSPLLPIHIVTS